MSIKEVVKSVGNGYLYLCIYVAFVVTFIAIYVVVAN